jgi:predicted ATPase
MFTLNIKNYRSFKDQTFDFSKMNILIGENSSGKSSLIKFFLALKQTFEVPNNKESNFTLTGEYADLGNYKETIYYHNDELPLEFSFTFKDYDLFFRSFLFMTQSDGNNKEKLEFADGIKSLINPDSKSINKIEYSLTKELDKHNKISTLITNSQYGSLKIIHKTNSKNNKINSLFGYSCTLEFYYKTTNETIILEDLTYEKDGFLSLITSASLVNSIVKYNNKKMEDYEKDDVFKNKVDIVYYTIAYMLVCQNYLKFYIDKIEYVNPIKTTPNRIYLAKDDKQAQHINDIEDFVNFFSRNNKSNNKILPDFVKVLNQFGILNDLEILKDDRLPVRELRVKIKNLLSNINDVGYGVSLQLPIILKCYLAEVLPERRGAIIFIEQPEVHLHPKLHAKLIETLFGLSKHTSYFIETHSEHIIRKMQVLIKERNNKFEPNDVTIHYMIRNDEDTDVTVHTIEKSGKLNPIFASGFFDNSYLLSKALLD